MEHVTIDELIEMYNNYFASDKGKWASADRNRLAYDAVAFEIPEQAEILDIGCGNGHTLEYFKVRHSKAKLYGLDLSPVAIEIAQNKLPEAEFYATDLLEFTSRKKWQIILCMGSLEHLLDPDAGLAKIKSLLKKDGIVYMELPDNLSYSAGKHEYRQLRSGSRQYEWHLSREEWEAKFEAAGFVIRRSFTNARPQWRFGWILE